MSLLCFLSGCTFKIDVPEITVPDPNAAWASVLKNHVDEKGRIDFSGLSADRHELEGYLTYVSKVSPESNPEFFRDDESKLAFYLNAYNALAIYNLIQHGVPKDNDSLWKRLKLFYFTKYKVSGVNTSLYRLETDILRPMGDPRVHVALNCGARSCPRLPQEPFNSKTLNQTLEERAHEFFNESRNVEIDPEKKTVRFSEILKFFTKDFLKKAPSLIAYVNQYRNEKIPEDYQVQFIKYDWTTNSQPR